MSKEIVYWVTRGHRFNVPDHSDLSVEQYQQLIVNNCCLENGDTGSMSLEAIEAQSDCVHFEMSNS
jgi:hypothetical protein